SSLRGRGDRRGGLRGDLRRGGAARRAARAVLRGRARDGRGQGASAEPAPAPRRRSRRGQGPAGRPVPDPAMTRLAAVLMLAALCVAAPAHAATSLRRGNDGPWLSY